MIPIGALDARPRPALHPARFLTVFVAGYVALHALYFAIPDRVLRDVVHYYGIVAPGAAMISLLAPGEPVLAGRGTLHSPKAKLDIVRGCDGAGLLFLLLSAVAAFPAGWKQKIWGTLGVLVVGYVLNEARIVALYFAAVSGERWFAALHNYFLPTFLIVVSAIFFAGWSAWAARRRLQGSV